MALEIDTKHNGVISLDMKKGLWNLKPCYSTKKGQALWGDVSLLIGFDPTYLIESRNPLLMEIYLIQVLQCDMWYSTGL